MTRLRIATVLAALCTIAPSVSAEPERDAVNADVLFQSGKECLKRGDWACACAKFAASQELDPSAGTLIRIAKCHEREGRLAAARNDLEKARRLSAVTVLPEASRRELEAHVTKLLAELEPRVPKLRIDVASAPAGLTLAIDGEPRPIQVLGESLDYDPGEHTLLLAAPGHAPLERKVTLAEAAHRAIELTLEKSASGPAGSTPAPEVSLQPASAGLLAEARATDLHARAVLDRLAQGQRTAGLVTAGAGVTVLGTAGVLGILTLTKLSARPAGCTTADPVCLTRTYEALRFETAGLVLACVGVAALGTGIVVYATAPRPVAGELPRAAAAVVASPYGLSVEGSW